MSNPFMYLQSNYTKIPSEIFKVKDLSSNAFRLFCYLASYEDCYPSYKAIKNAMGVGSFSTVKKAIQELLDFGMISYVPGYKNQPNTYKLEPIENWVITKNVIQETPTTKSVIQESWITDSVVQKNSWITESVVQEHPWITESVINYNKNNINKNNNNNSYLITESVIQDSWITDSVINYNKNNINNKYTTKSVIQDEKEFREVIKDLKEPDKVITELKKYKPIKNTQLASRIIKELYQIDAGTIIKAMGW